MGLYFGVTPKEIKSAIESYVPDNNRSQLLKKGTNEIILDAYNANPSSMKVAFENFIQLENKNKLMILGDMFELGDESNEEHAKLIQMMAPIQSVQCIFIGNYFYQNKIESDNLLFFKDFDVFSNYIKNNVPAEAFILIKGSRGMSLERTLDYI